jgi:hypothetical protein
MALDAHDADAAGVPEDLHNERGPPEAFGEGAQQLGITRVARDRRGARDAGAVEERQPATVWEEDFVGDGVEVHDSGHVEVLLDIAGGERDRRMSGVASVASFTGHPVAVALMAALVAIVVVILLANAVDWFRRGRP